jgi:hypothetical protein
MEDDDGLSNFELCYRHFARGDEFMSMARERNWEKGDLYNIMTSPWLTEKIFDKYPVNQHLLDTRLYDGCTTILRGIIYLHLSKNHNISLTYISNHIGEPWSYHNISQRSQITWADTVKYPNIRWDYRVLMERWCKEDTNTYVLK